MKNKFNLKNDDNSIFEVINTHHRENGPLQLTKASSVNSWKMKSTNSIYISSKMSEAKTSHIVKRFLPFKDGTNTMWICKYGRERNQTPKTGWSNLIAQIEQEHSE